MNSLQKEHLESVIRMMREQSKEEYESAHQANLRAVMLEDRADSLQEILENKE